MAAVAVWGRGLLRVGAFNSMRRWSVTLVTLVPLSHQHLSQTAVVGGLMVGSWMIVTTAFHL